MLVVDTDSDEYVKVEAVSIQTYIPSKDEFGLTPHTSSPIQSSLDE